MVIVYDPQTGHYFWLCSASRYAGDSFSFLEELESGMESVNAGPAGLLDADMPSDLFVQEHSERADSLEAAEDASIGELRRGLPVFAGHGYDIGSKDVPLFRAIGIEFACAPFGKSRLQANVPVSGQEDRLDQSRWRKLVAGGREPLGARDNPRLEIQPGQHQAAAGCGDEVALRTVVRRLRAGLDAHLDQPRRWPKSTARAPHGRRQSPAWSPHPPAARDAAARMHPPMHASATGHGSTRQPPSR